jgi:hypothetical protein
MSESFQASAGRLLGEGLSCAGYRGLGGRGSLSVRVIRGLLGGFDGLVRVAW